MGRASCGLAIVVAEESAEAFTPLVCGLDRFWCFIGEPTDLVRDEGSTSPHLNPGALVGHRRSPIGVQGDARRHKIGTLKGSQPLLLKGSTELFLCLRESVRVRRCRPRIRLVISRSPVRFRMPSPRWIFIR